MKGYFAPYERVIEALSLHHEGGAYTGQGFLRWSPDDGFRLDALVERAPGAPPLPKVSHIGQAGVLTKKDVSSIHLRLRGGGKALAPRVVVRDRLDLDGRSISLRIGRMLFF